MGKVAGKGLKVLGVGLSRTGTTSLTLALERLGYKTVHGECDALNDVLLGAGSDFNFRCFDHVDALTDVPPAYFYNELLAAYPDCKAILTVRDVDSWFDSYVNYDREMRRMGWFTHEQVVQHAVGITEVIPITLRRMIYGSYAMKEVLFKKTFRDHNRHVLQDIDKDRLLVMDIMGGDGWEVLCGFLGVSIPDEPFPTVHSIADIRNGASLKRPATYKVDRA